MQLDVNPIRVEREKEHFPMTTREMEQPQSHTIPSVHILHGSAQAPCQAPEDEYGRECLTCIVGVCVRCHMTELATECPGALEHFEAYQTLLNAGILDFRQGSWVFGPGPGAIEREQYRRPSDRRRPEPPSFANLRPEDVVAFEVAWMEARAAVIYGQLTRLEPPADITNRDAAEAYFAWRWRNDHSKAHVHNAIFNNARQTGRQGVLPTGDLVHGYYDEDER